MRWLPLLIVVSCAGDEDDEPTDPTDPADTDTDADSDSDTDADADTDSDADADTGPGSTGAACADDSECDSGECWDFSEYDPACSGTACTVACSYDIDCETAFAAAGAPAPSGAICGVDGLCDPVASGIGAFLCE